MRKLFFLGLIAAILLALPSLPASAQAVDPAESKSAAQTEPPDTIPDHMIVVNVGGLATEHVHLSYFNALSDHDALGLIAGAIYYPFSGTDVMGYTATLAYRYHPGHQALWRFYLSPQLGYQYAGISPDTSASGPTAALSIGWQWFPEGRLAVGVGFGLRYAFGGSDAASAAVKKVFGFRPVITFDLGYAW